jgi:tight adherence protein C
MIELIIDKLHDTRFLVTIFTAIAAMATVITVAMPYLANDNLGRRMKAVAIERSKIRAREREKLARGERVVLRREPKAYMQAIVEQLNLKKHLGQDEARAILSQAGHRGQGAYIAFLFFRLIAPIAMLVAATLYLFVIVEFAWPLMVKAAVVLAAAWIGMKLPFIFLKNLIKRRQVSIKRAFPDALDLLLICVESGMSIEVAFRRVSQEIGTQSVALAEEFTLTTAELSYLQDRRQAYDNLAARTNLDGVKAVCTALVQAERYGTPLGTALRVLAQENRDMRMAEAEKKAAALPPKLTVPMIIFFLPVLFVVILGPAFIRVMELK